MAKRPPAEERVRREPFPFPAFGPDGRPRCVHCGRPAPADGCHECDHCRRKGKR